MCLVIVDVNVAPRVLLRSDDAEYKLLHGALFGRRRPNPILVHGGYLTQEYAANRSVLRMVYTLDRAGRVVVVPDARVAAAAGAVAAEGTAISNDTHLLGLARESGARVLCSEDRDLRADFKNKQLVDGPRGKVYSKTGHGKVLAHNC